MYGKGLAGLLVGLLLIGCSEGARELTYADPQQSLPDALLTFQNHELRDRLLRKKYFLIAGGEDNANFAQEIVEQKRFLLSLGVKESEISCFYSRPSLETFIADETQYRELAQELSACYPAYSRFVWEQLADGAEKPEFIYLYVSSHGSNPSWWGQSWLEELPLLRQFMILLDAGPDGRASDPVANARKVLNGENDASDVFFTPRYLREALSKFDADIPKFAVIQGCYSGGFLEGSDDNLKSIPAITVMTASRPDRTSFGCNSDGFRTYFGGAFTDALREGGLLPSQVDWPSMYQDVYERVEHLEEEYEGNLNEHQKTHFLPSEPRFYQSRELFPLFTSQVMSEQTQKL